MIGRRACLTLLGAATAAALLWPRLAHAQQRLVGVLIPISSAAAARNIEAFRAGLRDLGHSESRDIRIEVRFADGTTERLPGLASELVALKPAVIVAGGPQAAVAVRNATPTIPVVMNSSENPIALGLAVSLARPGGNVTGFWWGDEGLVGKQLELLKEVVSGIARVGIMVDPSDSNSTEPLKSLPDVSRALGLAISVIEARQPADFEPAFTRTVRENLQGLHIGITPLFINDRSRLAALAANARLPVIYGMREFAEVGGLISYGMSLPGLYRDKARLVDKILSGASPADLPIERPTKLELVVNLKAAKALGLTIPESFLIRADQVIEP
jgi:putative tryptophan/tyrosine transport system substrate-binding protein